jgi:hypothetical protein
LDNIDQYTAIFIYAGDELITRIHDIEKIS